MPIVTTASQPSSQRNCMVSLSDSSTLRFDLLDHLDPQRPEPRV